jgi:hypothetical protein
MRTELRNLTHHVRSLRIGLPLHSRDSFDAQNLCAQSVVLEKRTENGCGSGGNLLRVYL